MLEKYIVPVEYFYWNLFFAAFTAGLFCFLFFHTEKPTNEASMSHPRRETLSRRGTVWNGIASRRCFSL